MGPCRKPHETPPSPYSRPIQAGPQIHSWAATAAVRAPTSDYLVCLERERGMSRNRESATDAQPLAAAPSSAFDTTEVRWFAAGSLPASYVEWFSSSGGATLEVRRDCCLVDPSHDIGRKRRNDGPFEIKIRMGSTSIVGLWEGLRGRLERWQKTVGQSPSMDRAINGRTSKKSC